MADAQIAQILIPCLVVQFNNQQYIETTEAGIQVIGQTLNVPCRNMIPSDVGYWAVPVKDYGIFTKLQWILMRENNSTYVPQPTFDSFPVFTVNDKMNNNTWWIYGTPSQFFNSCNTCCGNAAVSMPGIDGAFLPLIAPCQQFCNVPNNAGALQAYFGIPNLLGGDTWFPYGSYNNVAFPAASASGYATVALLLTYLNATWGTGGSSSLTYTTTPDNLTLVVQGGALSDSICIVIARIGPSS